MSAVGAGAALERLLSALGRARARMTGAALPDAGEIAGLAGELEAAREALEKDGLGSAPSDLEEEEKAALIRMAVDVKLQMRLVSRLAAGGARYAALLKSLGTDSKPAGIYGRAGAAQDGRGGSMERRI